MPDDQVSRRHLLAGLLAASVLSSAGCSSSSAGQPRREPAVLPRVDPDVTARAAAAEAERILVAAYAATIAAHPALAADLAPFAADHAAHLAAFDDSSPGPATHANGTAGAARQ